MKEHFKSFCMSIYAGVFIALGCAVNLMLCAGDALLGKYIGALLFSAGILCCIIYKTPLVTGVFPTFKAKNNYLLRVFLATAGNFVGTMIVRVLLLGYPDFAVQNAAIDSFSVYSLIASSMLCGFVIGLIVLQQHKWMALLLIPVFILSRYQHVVVNMFILPQWWQILICFAGNWIGGALSGFLYKRSETA